MLSCTKHFFLRFLFASQQQHLSSSYVGCPHHRKGEQRGGGNDPVCLPVPVSKEEEEEGGKKEKKLFITHKKDRSK